MSRSRSPEAAAWKQQFGATLREARTAAGMSQMDLAHASDLDPTYISSVEQGRRNVSLVNICVLARSLDVSASDLLRNIS